MASLKKKMEYLPFGREDDLSFPNIVDRDAPALEGA
jgi:hypothetical protein